VAVGVRGELGGDLGFQRLDLGVQAGQHGGQGAGHLGAGGSRIAGGAPRRRRQPLVEAGWAGAAAVTGGFQPGGQPFLRQPAGAVLAAGAGQEGQADRRVELAEQASRAGEHQQQVGAQLVAHRDPVAHQILTGPAGLAQRDRGRGVRDQRPQPGPVGAQHIGEHVGAGAGRPYYPPTHSGTAGS
jgi:hypothetical protein